MSLLQEPAPGTGLQRRQQSSADKRATVFVAVGFALTLGAVLGLPGPSLWFMGLAPVIAIATGFPALLAVLVERHRGGMGRLLLGVGAVALAAVGVYYLRSADGTRVVLGYLLPAALFAGAALTLAAPRLRAKAAT